MEFLIDIEGLNIGPHDVKKVQLKPLDRNNTSFGNKNGEIIETINHTMTSVLLTNLKESSGTKFILPKKMFPGLYQKIDVEFEDGLKNENDVRDIDMGDALIKTATRCRRASSKAVSKRNKRRIIKRNFEMKTSAIKRNQVKNNTMKKIERQRKRVIREKKESKIQRKRNNKKTMKIMNQKLASFRI